MIGKRAERAAKPSACGGWGGAGSGEGIRGHIAKAAVLPIGRTTDEGGSGYAESGDAGGWTKGADEGACPPKADIVPELRDR